MCVFVCLSLQKMIMDKQEKRKVFSDVYQSATASANKGFHQSSEEISTLSKTHDQEIRILDIELVLTRVLSCCYVNQLFSPNLECIIMHFHIVFIV